MGPLGKALLLHTQQHTWDVATSVSAPQVPWLAKRPAAGGAGTSPEPEKRPRTTPPLLTPLYPCYQA